MSANTQPQESTFQRGEVKEFSPLPPPHAVGEEDTAEYNPFPEPEGGNGGDNLDRAAGSVALKAEARASEAVALIHPALATPDRTAAHLSEVPDDLSPEKIAELNLAHHYETGFIDQNPKPDDPVAVHRQIAVFSLALSRSADFRRYVGFSGIDGHEKTDGVEVLQEEWRRYLNEVPTNPTLPIPSMRLVEGGLHYAARALQYRKMMQFVEGHNFEVDFDGGANPHETIVERIVLATHVYGQCKNMLAEITEMTTDSEFMAWAVGGAEEEGRRRAESWIDRQEELSDKMKQSEGNIPLQLRHRAIKLVYQEFKTQKEGQAGLDKLINEDEYGVIGAFYKRKIPRQRTKFLKKNKRHMTPADEFPWLYEHVYGGKDNNGSFVFKRFEKKFEYTEPVEKPEGLVEPAKLHRPEGRTAAADRSENSEKPRHKVKVNYRRDTKGELVLYQVDPNANKGEHEGGLSGSESSQPNESEEAETPPTPEEKAKVFACYEAITILAGNRASFRYTEEVLEHRPKVVQERLRKLKSYIELKEYIEDESEKKECPDIFGDKLFKQCFRDIKKDPRILLYMWEGLTGKHLEEAIALRADPEVKAFLRKYKVEPKEG